MAKDRTDQDATEMKFDDFVSWATSYILFGIAEGQKLRSLIWMVCNQAAQNTVWGSQKSHKLTTAEILRRAREQANRRK